MRLIPSPGKVLSVSLCLLGLLAGCDANATRYPKELRYPSRKDVLVVKQSGAEPIRLPSPGQLDESIVDGLHEVIDGKKVPAKGVEFVDPAKLDEAKTKSLRQALIGVFGTPMMPRVETNAAPDLGLDTGTLAEGSELYRKHCMHCHGVAGDGRGPTAPWVHPHPRDYRSGRFKFLSNADKYNDDVVELKPSRSDLYRVIHKGIDGTSMPAFTALPDREINSLVSYVTHLSIRGEVEFRAIVDLMKPDGRTKGNADAIEKFVQDEAEKLTNDWLLMSNPAVQIKPSAAYPTKYTGPDKDREMADSIARGYKLFTAKGDGGCIACHSDFGRQTTYRYDVWGTLVQPRNLTVSTYRGGRRPIDFYWRIKAGIPPAGMPKQSLNDEQVWDVVHFVQAMPYPLMLPREIRDKVYGSYMTEPKPETKKEKH